MSAPTPLQLLADAARRNRELLACLDERADGFTSEPDVEPDWNDPDTEGD